MGNFDGRFVWYELATTDIEAAKAFYVSVVGWGTGDASVPGSVYSVFAAGDTPVAGLIELPAEAKRTGAPPQWIGYVGVDDVDIAAGRVKQLGGTVHVPPTDIPNISRFSVIADPQMATLVLFKGRERAQKQSVKPGTPGHVGWHELLAADWERAFAFYNQLLGWQKAGAHVNAMGTYQLFSDGTETIGGMWNSKSPLPLWFYYFNVGDIEAAAKRVEANGGEIFYGPIAVPGGARVVHCKDPQGALFALIDWCVRITIGCYSPSRRRPAQT
jgi:predicted enzyme related to lactoylglutathione lyase